MEQLRIVDKEMIRADGGICFDKLDEGFHQFPYFIISGTESELELFIETCVRKNGLEHSFFDFYYAVLSKEDKYRFVEDLNKIDEKVSEQFDTVKDNIYFGMGSDFLSFLCKITAKELLFSTFYFTRFPCTIWGNYGLKYPVFFKDEKTMNYYAEIARECECDLEQHISSEV